jgi:biotin carboxyl carrier protein
MKITLRDGETTHDATVTRVGDSVTVTRPDGRAFGFTVVSASGGVLVVARGSRLFALRGQDTGPHDRQIQVGGRTVAYAVSTPDTQDAAGSGDLAATIPSVVLEVLVVPGERVAAGDRMILLESMKMVMPLVAPSDGTVLSVLCSPGDAVQPGVNLIEFAPEAAS